MRHPLMLLQSVAPGVVLAGVTSTASSSAVRRPVRRVLAQRVHAIVTLVPSSTEAAPGERVRIVGEVAPSRAGERVLIEERGSRG